MRIQHIFSNLLLIGTLLVPVVVSAQTSTPPPEIIPITRNVDWTPVVQEFGGVEMVLVPAGCFMMGSENVESHGQPVHRQCFDAPFWIDQYEVTNGQYGSAGLWSGDNRPRESVTWHEAREFCDSRGARLPTELEWEYAARGPDSLIYPWGNDFVAYNVVHYRNSGGQTADVGGRAGGVSWVGAYDMGGNVWEWTSSGYAGYPYDNDGRETDEGYDFRVIRGGPFDGLNSNLRSAYRLRYDPDIPYFKIGFRCARGYSG